MAYLRADMCDSLTQEHLECLHKANIWTVNDLFSRKLMDVKHETSIRFQVLKDLHDKLKQRYTLPSRDLNYLLEKCVSECKMCPTGLPELTQALDGGFQTQEIVEFSGDSETGKTELCYLLCGEILSHYEDYEILYIASDHDFDHEKIIKYTKSKAGNRYLSDDDLHKALARVELAKPTKLTDLVHLLNTLVHSDKRNAIRCIIIDSLSFIIQEEVLDIKTVNLDDADELERWVPFRAQSTDSSSIDAARREILDTYLHEIMRLLVTIAVSKNAIIVLTNSNQNLSTRKTWTNAIDHRIQLSRIPDYSRHAIDNPRATVCRATILKTIHNITKIGSAIPFMINDDGLFAVKDCLPPLPDETHQNENQYV